MFPLTVEGNIVAHRELTSCFTSSYNDLAHIAITPISDGSLRQYNGYLMRIMEFHLSV